MIHVASPRFGDLDQFKKKCMWDIVRYVAQFVSLLAFVGPK